MVYSTKLSLGDFSGLSVHVVKLLFDRVELGKLSGKSLGCNSGLPELFLIVLICLLLSCVTSELFYY